MKKQRLCNLKSLLLIVGIVYVKTFCYATLYLYQVRKGRCDMSGDDRHNLGLLLKELLRERSLSMRKLSEMTEIDTATISRIINGKRKANIQHLEKFADCLEVPITGLLEAEGYSIEAKQEIDRSDIHASVEEIKEVLKLTNSYDNNFSIEAVDQRLENFGQYSQTKEGEDTILNSFEEKIEKIGSIGPFIDQLKELFIRFKKRKGTPYELIIIGSALLYFISPVDVIPDYIFPIGYLDDAIAVQIALKSLKQ